MKLKNRFRSILAIALFTTLQACSYADIVTEDETDIPITQTIKYQPDVMNIMYNFCITCHSGGAPSANLDLSTYQNVKNATQNGNLLNRMKSSSNPMPPSGVLSNSQIQIIEKWVTDGYLN